MCVCVSVCVCVCVCVWVSLSLCVCVKRGYSDTANLHHICWACSSRSARSGEGHGGENLSRVMNMSLWCPTNVRLWLSAEICKTAPTSFHLLPIGSVAQPGEAESLLYRPWLLNWGKMSWASFNKLIAVCFLLRARTTSKGPDTGRSGVNNQAGHSSLLCRWFNLIVSKWLWIFRA